MKLLTTGQYRALVAYLNFWTPDYPKLDLDQAIKDIGIAAEKDTVIHELFKAGWIWDDDKKIISNTQEEENG